MGAEWTRNEGHGNCGERPKVRTKLCISTFIGINSQFLIRRYFLWCMEKYRASNGLWDPDQIVHEMKPKKKIRG